MFVSFNLSRAKHVTWTSKCINIVEPVTTFSTHFDTPTLKPSSWIGKIDYGPPGTAVSPTIEQAKNG